MQFLIDRITSHRNPKAAPCRNAFQDGERFAGPIWKIEISSLDELLALQKEVNDKLIVGQREITILDDCPG